MTRTSSSSSTSGGSSSSSSSSSSRCGCQCMSATGAGGAAAGVGTDVVLAAVGPHISGFECTLAGKPGFEAYSNMVLRESRASLGEQ